MTKFFGSVAMAALLFAGSVTPAFAQGGAVLPTITSPVLNLGGFGSTLQNGIVVSPVHVGVTLTYTVTAASKSGSPKLVLASAPAGSSVVSTVSVPSSHGSDPSTVMTVAYTPSLDQVGVTQFATFTASTAAGSVSATAGFQVLDVPTDLTGLTATFSADHSSINAAWNPSTIAGVGAVSYNVMACYVIPPVPGQRFGTTVCDQYGSTTNTAISIPAVSQPDVNGVSRAYTSVSVTPVSPSGVVGASASVAPTI